VLFPVLTRQNEALALGYVTAPVIESTFIAIGIVSLLAIVTLRQDVGGPGGASSLVPVGRSLVAIHDWAFLLGPGWIVGVGNGLILGYLMYRSGLVPRRMAMLGLIGGPLIIISGSPTLSGAAGDAGADGRSGRACPGPGGVRQLIPSTTRTGRSPASAGLRRPCPAGSTAAARRWANGAHRFRTVSTKRPQVSGHSGISGTRVRVRDMTRAAGP
jgi:hypothetical protein